MFRDFWVFVVSSSWRLAIVMMSPSFSSSRGSVLPLPFLEFLLARPSIIPSWLRKIYWMATRARIRNMPKTTYLARVSVVSAEEDGRMEFITGIGLFNGMKWNE